MLIIGLTGGIGSGKSAAAVEFESLGAFVVDADQVAREVVEPGTSALAGIADHFGSAVINSDGELDRRKLREIVFSSPPERMWLEGLLHPAINAELGRRISASQAAYSVLVSPLLLEGNQREMVHRILVVDCPEELQLARTIDRDDCSPVQVRQIMQAQMSRTTRLQQADDLIQNNADLEHLQRQVRKLHSSYLDLANRNKETPGE